MVNIDRKEAVSFQLSEQLGSCGFRLIKLIVDQPWSTVWFGVDDDDTPVIVKHRKHNPTTVHNVWPQVSALLSPRVPELLHHDGPLGLSVFEYVQSGSASAARASTEQTVLAYGACQSIAAALISKLSDLPVFDPLECFETVLAHCRGVERGNDSPQNMVFDFIPAADRDRAADTLARFHDAVREKLGSLTTCSITINHSDLTSRNTILRPDGSVCILDWDDASIAPPGLSLHMPFGGAVRVAASLLRPQAYQNPKLAERDCGLMDSYIRELCLYQGFEPDALRQVLPIMAAIGSLKYTYDMLPYDLGQDGLGQVVAKEAVSKFKDFVSAANIILGAPNKNNVAQSTQKRADRKMKFPSSDDFETHAEMANEFRKKGALLVKGAFERDVIARAYKSVVGGKDQIMSDIQTGKALRVGGRRYMLSVDTDGIFGSPEVLAAPPLLGVMEAILGPDCILGSNTVVLSLNGSDDQHWHRDNDPLFREFGGFDTPPYCITVLVPLVPLDETIGATEVEISSHRPPYREQVAENCIWPDVQIGDCYLMDCRVMHRGMANRSNVARPVLSLVYQRPWFRDYQNFKNQSALTISAETAQRFPEASRRLIDWAVAS